VPVRVVKIGGSLLDWPPLPRALAAWQASQPPAFNVLVCGGGPLAETIRRADRDFRLGEERSHGLSIETLAVAARLLAAIVPTSELITSYAELQQAASASQATSVIFDPRELLISYEAELPPARLPHSWSVTSDSIAARLAETLTADELVLLKSTASPKMATPSDMAAAGLVDPYFPTIAARLSKIRVVNLRCVT
jgi:aspartokinase-like uncharacterized kinase